jgi:hypothetical protein
MGEVRGTGAASPAELKGLCLVFWWPLFTGDDMRCQDQRMLIGTSGTRDFLFSKTKNAGQKPAFLVRFVHRLRIVVHRLRTCLIVYGFLGAAGVVVGGVGLVPKSTVGGASLPGAASKYVLGLAPITFAVIACGKVRIYVLYV